MDDEGDGLIFPSSPISSALPPHLRKRLEKRNKENTHDIKIETVSVAPPPTKTTMPSSPSRCVRAAEQLNKKRQERRQDQDRRRAERGDSDE